MSSIFDNEKNKNKCQKFTNNTLVETMLDMAGYVSNLSGKRILEYSFGTGNILKSILKRYISDGLRNGISPETISISIQRDIHGIELDEELFNDSINDLNKIIDSFKLPPVRWSLYNEDALKHRFEISFDFIVGNPPYISYKDIDSDSKKYIKENYVTCSKGKFDYCYAFIEMGVRLLNDSGKLVQLIPSNIYKNVFANELRKLLSPHLEIIWEYPEKRMFEDTLTSSSIFLFNKKHTSGIIDYRNITEDYREKISSESLSGKWIFKAKDTSLCSDVRFGDHFNASIAVATLLNKAFVMNKEEKENSKIEEDVLRFAVSPRSLRYNREDYIIFPYYYSDKGVCRFSSDEFKTKFPYAFQHLNNFRMELEQRDSDKSALWFEYGRSQALGHLNQEKILLSTVVTNKVEAYILEKNIIPYSGIYITVKSGKYSLEDAKQIIQSELFFDYVQRIGISVSGKSKRITCKDINNFTFVKEATDGKTEIYC